MHNATMQSYFKCPDCGADVQDWREFLKQYPDLAVGDEHSKPFQCVGFRCGKRWKTEEILQNGGNDG